MSSVVQLTANIKRVLKGSNNALRWFFDFEYIRFQLGNYSTNLLKFNGFSAHWKGWSDGQTRQILLDLYSG